MGFYRNDDTLNIRVNSILKDKFHVAIGFLDVSSVIQTFIQDYVRKYEQTNGIIPVNPSYTDLYHMLNGLLGNKISKDKYKNVSKGVFKEIVSTMLGFDISDEDFEYLLAKYPKSKLNAGVYGVPTKNVNTL